MGDSLQRNSGRKRSNDDDDPKRKKNRDAARKSREKKMNETLELRKKNEELMKINEDFAKKKRVYEEKLNECIQEIRRHEASGCKLPQDVARIINSADLSKDDMTPVAIQTSDDSSSLSYPNPEVVEELESPPTEFEPIIGLFSGNQFPANGVGRSRKRNLSSRSSSASPQPTSVRPQSQTPTSSSMKNVSSFTRSSTQPSWNCLHQQMIGELSPGLSPAQTVPNIDIGSEGFSFPDPSVALRNAQEDQGVTEDEEYENDSSNQESFASLLHFQPNNHLLPQTGFSSHSATSCASPQIFQHSQYNTDQSIGKGMSKSIPFVKNIDTLKPSSSVSPVVSMNHTAELLSQAMTNFDASEISEDLRNQIARLANNKEQKEGDSNLLKNQNLVPTNEWQHPVHQEQQQLQQSSFMQPQSSAGNGEGTVSYDALLKLAKNEQSIEVQFQGKEYVLSYEQLKQFIYSRGLMQTSYSEPNVVVETAPDSNFPQNSTTFYGTSQEITNVVSTNPDITFIAPQEILTVVSGPGSAFITPQQVLTANNTFAQSSQPVGTTQQIFVDNPIENGQLAAQQVFVDNPIEDGQVPTTVLSMIQEDVMSKPGSSNELTSLDSIDYSDNVKELPSLSLTEDHSRIFEKKRKLHHELH